MINANWGHGGPGGIVKDIYDILTKNGHECIVAYGRGSCPKEINSVKIGSLFTNVIDFFISHLFDNAGRNSYFATKRLIKHIERIKPDIVHLHNLLGYYINFPVLFHFLKNNNCKVVWTIHDCWAITGHCINFERINCTKWIDSCKNCQLKTDYPKSILFDNSKKNYSIKKDIFNSLPFIHLVAPSLWLKNLISHSYLSNLPISVINNGIDTNVFKFRKNDIKKRYGIDGKIVLLFVASVWNEMKGINIVLDLSRCKMNNDRALSRIRGFLKSGDTHIKKLLVIEKNVKQFLILQILMLV